MFEAAAAASKKCELDELKEKIMKLEQRNFELERKLSSNNVLNPSAHASKENSFTDSSFTNADSINNESLTKAAATAAAVAASTPVFQPAKPSFQQTLNTIPNINQGGFIITSNGSIAYVPPSNLQNIQSTPKEDKPAEAEPIKLDFDAAKNSNLDLGSFLGKSLFNPASANSSSSSAKSAQASPVKNSPSSSTLASSSSNKQPAQAYILSNGQLVPVNPAPASLSPVVPIQPKQLAPLLPLQPKTGATSTPLAATKAIKPKKAKAKPKSTPQQSEPIQLDLSSLLVPVAAPSPASLLPVIKPAAPATTPQPAVQLNGKIAIAPLGSSSAGKRPREIRPKPSSNASSTSKLHIQPAKPVASLVINPVMESNDILAKAASMIFSPSEFNSLNTLSPHAAPSTTILNQAISLSSPSGGGGGGGGGDVVFTPVANIQPKPAKVAIQRYSSQNSLPTTSKLKNLKPLATSVSNSNLATKTSVEASKKAVKPKPASANSAKLILPANKSSSSQNLKPLLPNTALATDTMSANASSNINLIDFQKFNETSLVSMCDLEAFSQSLLFSSSSSIIVANGASLEKSSSAPPVEIQSILGKCMVTPSKNATTTSNSEEEAEESKKATVKTKERSKSPEIMSMPSLEQFFEIELGSCANSSAEEASKHKSPQAIKPKQSASKKLLPSPGLGNYFFLIIIYRLVMGKS